MPSPIRHAHKLNLLPRNARDYCMACSETFWANNKYISPMELPHSRPLLLRAVSFREQRPLSPLLGIKCTRNFKKYPRQNRSSPKMPKRLLQLRATDKKRMLQPRRIELINLTGDCCCLLAWQAGWLQQRPARRKMFSTWIKLRFLLFCLRHLLMMIVGHVQNVQWNGTERIAWQFTLCDFSFFAPSESL